MDIAYVPMCADILHYGHIRILDYANMFGDIIVVGLVSDESMASYKRSPVFKYKYRKEVLEAITSVDLVLEAKGHVTRKLFLDHISVLEPKYVIHGNDWDFSFSPLWECRENIIKLLSEFDGILLEPDITEGVSTSWIIEKLQQPNQ